MVAVVDADVVVIMDGDGDGDGDEQPVASLRVARSLRREAHHVCNAAASARSTSARSAFVAL